MPGEKEEIKIPEETVENKAPEGYTQEEWDGLSPTEREGLLTKDEDLEPKGLEIPEETLKAIAGEEEKKPEEKVEEKKGEEEAKGAAEGERGKEKAGEEAAKKEEAGQVAAAGEETAKADTKAEEAAGERVSDDDLLRFRPVVQDSELPAVDTVPAEVAEKLDALDSKYDAGEIDLKQYNRERDALNRQVTMANISAREDARYKLTWDREQQYFFANRPEYGVRKEDGTFEMNKENKQLYGALGEMIKDLEKNPRYSGAPGMELLIAADRAVSRLKEALGLIEKPTPAKKEEAKVEKKAEPERKPPAKMPDVKTLAEIPAAAGNQTLDPWKALDRLEGEAYEEALSKLTDAQRDAYLRDTSRARA